MNWNSGLVAPSFPAHFVIDTAVPTEEEILAGYRDRWIDRAGTVGLALAKLERGYELTPIEERIAYLLSDEYDQLDDIAEVDDKRMPNLEIPDPSNPVDQFWLFINLAWLWQHRDSYDQPLEIVDQLYDDFGYPDPVRPFTGFMPAGPKGPVGVEGLFERWRQYLESESARYAERARSWRRADR